MIYGDGEGARPKRCGVKTSYFNSGQVALAHLQYIVAGEIAGSLEKSCGSGALLTNLAHLLEPSVILNIEKARRR